MRNLRKNLLFLAMSLSVCPVLGAASDAVISVRDGFTLNPESLIETSPYYAKVTESLGRPGLFEKSKILYLIGQIRSSSFEFERNGRIYTGSKAASHLMMKYGFAKDRVKTAEEFIQFIASESSETHKPYYVIDASGIRHKTQEVLVHELSLLERKLQHERL